MSAPLVPPMPKETLTDDALLLSNRRNFLTVVGGVSAGCLAACGGAPPPQMTDMAPHDFGLPQKETFSVPEAGNLQVGQSIIVQSVFFSMSRTIIARDAKGFMAIWSYCRHAGCPVYINDVDKSYDCRCHGSRYQFDGAIRQGPTTDPLWHLELTRQNNLLVVGVNIFIAELTGRTA